MAEARLRVASALFALAAAAQAFAAGAAPAPQLVSAQSSIGFVSHQMGVPVAGRFQRFDAQASFDPANPGGGRFVVVVDLGSVDLPTADATREVAKPGWFDVARFPRAQFESTSVRAVGPGRYEIAGRLAIKGRALDVRVPVRLERAGALAVASGSVTVARLAFGIGDGEWSDTSLVADEVQIDFRLAFSGLAVN